MISIFKNQFDTLHIKQRFTIKKLSIGVVSVLVGFTFCGLNGQSVSADSTLETDSTSTVVSANPTVDEKEYTSIPVSDIKGNARSVSVTSEIDSTSFNDSTNVIKLDTKDEVVVGIQPDGSTDGATIPVIIANKTQAETNNPVGKKLTITVNGKLPDASDLIQNIPSMPEGTKYSYKEQIDTTTTGKKNVVVVVTYPDGSSDEVSVQLTVQLAVQSYAEIYEPIGQNQTIKVGVEPDPRELIANSIAMPEGTKYSYKVPIDTKTPGIKNVVVVVTYPDGSSDAVSVQLTVQYYAETYNPIGQNQTVKIGVKPDPRELIANSIALPEGTKYSYNEGQIDTGTPGIKNVVVVVTYPDGSSDEVNVQLTVQSYAETYNPIGQNQTVKIGVEPDPRELIANSIAMPEGTKYSYKGQIDTKTPGVKQVVVVVTYPDGSSDEVSVELTVQSYAET
ncbi:YSIRK-type signal peptide-containing protein, partial [Leuconostoc lactis]